MCSAAKSCTVSYCRSITRKFCTATWGRWLWWSLSVWPTASINRFATQGCHCGWWPSQTHGKVLKRTGEPKIASWKQGSEGEMAAGGCQALMPIKLRSWGRTVDTDSFLVSFLFLLFFGFWYFLVPILCKSKAGRAGRPPHHTAGQILYETWREEATAAVLPAFYLVYANRGVQMTCFMTLPFFPVERRRSILI